MTVVEDPIVVQDREELIYLLSEAAELEHGLMCCYLYAAFSLKSTTDEGITQDEVAAVRRWRQLITSVAVEEMLHLALVSNLLTSIGAAPHFIRPNFPVAAGYYPAGIRLALTPFHEQTLEHFIFLERPEGVQLEDARVFKSTQHYQQLMRPSQLMASAQDFATVGHLYRGIEDGFSRLCEKLGETGLFIGDAAVQATSSLLSLPGFHGVTHLASALSAIETIVEQGEGFRGELKGSHYAKFLEVREEYQHLKAKRPSFEPARAAATNPVMRKPADPIGRVYLEAPEAAVASDIGNASYGLMVLMLARFFGYADSEEARKALINAAIELMTSAVKPIAELLTTLPANRSFPGVTAGLSFALPRSTHGLGQRRAAFLMFRERAEEIAAACKKAESPLCEPLHAVGEEVARIAESLTKHID